MTRGRAWPWALAAILLASVLANVAFLVLATSDPAAAVEPDYYRKAVAWDSEMAQRQHNATLGWQARAVLYLGAPGRLEVRLVDASGRPLNGAAIEAFVMHNARASAQQAVTLSADGRGRYVAPIRAERPGVWEIRLDVRQGAERFTAVQRLEAWSQ
jgi:hypothetical protein